MLRATTPTSYGPFAAYRRSATAEETGGVVATDADVVSGAEIGDVVGDRSVVSVESAVVVSGLDDVDDEPHAAATVTRPSSRGAARFTLCTVPGY
jgi:hypothetical protein